MTVGTPRANWPSQKKASRSDSSANQPHFPKANYRSLLFQTAKQNDESNDFIYRK